MKKGFGIIAILIVLTGALLGGLFGKISLTTTSAGTEITTERIAADYGEALDAVAANYAGALDREKIAESSIQGMLYTLDPHSSFFTQDEFRKLQEDQSSQFYGIGVSILQHRDGVYVQSIIPNTPADKAGLRYGDQFVEVGGKDAREWTSAEVSKNVRGERGSAVNLKVARPGFSAPLEFTIVRGGVPLPSIRNYFMLPNSVGYVGFTGGFQETSADEMDAAIAELKQQGMKSMILDMRNNPGGLLPQAIEIVSRFIPRGQSVVSVKGRSRYTRSQRLDTVGAETQDFPLVVMINGGSASAAEIVAGALQDYGRAVIVGTDSFGKGLVQKVFPLVGGTGLTLTTARYYTPFGRSLQRDYSSGSIYDYYTHHGATDEDGEANTSGAQPKPAGSPVTTAGGRVFYGGRGIEPDVKAQPLEYTALRGRINEAAFFFVRQLVGGQIKGFESYKAEKQNYNQTVAQNDFQIGDKLLEAFKAFAARDEANGLSAANINSQIDYAKSRLREEIATANFSTEAGQQVLLETDPQVLKAVDAVSEARKLQATIAASK
jgi:carboxyl-terminal processing protease